MKHWHTLKSKFRQFLRFKPETPFQPVWEKEPDVRFPEAPFKSDALEILMHFAGFINLR